MPLNWNTAEGSPARETMTTESRYASANLSVCLALMHAGMSSITEANLADVYARVQLLEKIYGPFLQWTDKDGILIKGLSLPVLRHFIGLSVNVASETEAKFVKRQIGGFLNDARRDARRDAQR
jgi:hypothetical protein